MQAKITRISVIWAERTGQGPRFRIYDVLPDNEKIIRAERMEELVDDLSLICQPATGGPRPHAEQHGNSGP